MKEKQKENLKTVVQVLSIIATIVLAIIMCIGVSKIKSDTNLQAEIARTKTYEQVKDGDEKIQITNSEGETVDFDYVQFNAFFLKDLNGDGYAEKIRGTCKEVGSEDTLYLSVNVLTNGTLKNGKIEIIGDNIYFQTALVDDDCIKGNYISDNTKEIELKEIGTGTQKLIFGNVRTGVYTNPYRKTEVIGNDTTKYTGINKVKFTGIHVSTDGKETPLEKEIELPVDWYAKPNAEIPYTYAGNKKNRYQSYNSDNMINRENQTIDLSFKIVEQETKNLQNLSKAYVEGEIPELNGYAPTNVEITGTNATYTYDKETRKYTAQREAVVDSTGKVISEAYSGSYKTERYNEFDVKVSYPIEAYETLGIDTVNIDIPIRGYYEGYNNPQEEFENPIRSNLVEDIISVVYSYGGGDVIAFDVKVGKYVSKPYDAWVVSKEKPERIYKNVENTNYEEDTYEVMWAVERGADGKISNVKLKETDANYTDKFLTTDNQYKSMEEITTNKGIYFKSAGNMFGKDGYINVINDETGELIHQFTANDWDTYTKENPYLYETGIKHIRIETSEASKNSIFYVYNIKEINDEKLTQSFTQEEFEKLRLIYSYMTGYIKYNETDEYIVVKNDLERANYDSIKSIVSINKVDPVYYSTQETKENAKITIRTQILEYNTLGWQNGEFLLKFPEEILEVEINNVTISNSDVIILGYSSDKKEDGYYLKILTENVEPEAYDIVVDCDITPDPRNLTVSKDIELYSINPICTSYKKEAQDQYDLDNDGNTQEYVGTDSYKVQLVGPTSLVTMETASEYNDKHDELETSIAPQVALIDKAQEDKTAKVSASILNNYSGNISGIKLVGKIPFKGNKSQINEEELGSTFTTTMTGKIVIPEDIKEYTKVYYSENEVVTEDLEDSTNNWIPEEEMTDYSKVKTYLIDLGDYVMQKGEEQICTYQLRVPEGLDYNEVAYSTHAVYFYLETSEGKLLDKTETNKLGFMIAKKYNLQIEKVKEGTEIKLKNAVYKLTEEGKGTTQLGVTNEEGILTFKDLFVERTYVLEESKAPEGYQKSAEKVRLTTTVNESGELEL